MLRAQQGVGPAEQHEVLIHRAGGRHQRDRRLAAGDRQAVGGVDPLLPQQLQQLAAERIGADPSHEAGVDPEPRQADGDVGRRPARRRREDPRRPQGGPGRAGEQVEQRLAQTDHVRHVRPTASARSNSTLHVKALLQFVQGPALGGMFQTIQGHVFLFQVIEVLQDGLRDVERLGAAGTRDEIVHAALNIGR